MKTMRAKLKITSVISYNDPDGKPNSETLKFSAVYKDGPYPADGLDEDNTFSKFTPSASLEMNIANPALLGQFKEGQKFYLDFTPAE